MSHHGLLILHWFRHRAVSRTPKLTTVAATRLIFGQVASTVVGLGFRATFSTFLWLGLGLSFWYDLRVTTKISSPGWDIFQDIAAATDYLDWPAEASASDSSGAFFGDDIIKIMTKPVDLEASLRRVKIGCRCKDDIVTTKNNLLDMRLWVTLM